jgi:hypothetical protein
MVGAHGGAWCARPLACVCTATKHDVHLISKHPTRRPWITAVCCMSRHPNPLSVHRVVADLVRALSAEIKAEEARWGQVLAHATARCSRGWRRSYTHTDDL